MTIVRRCNFLPLRMRLLRSREHAPILEDNLLVECGMPAEDDILPVEIPGCRTEGRPDRIQGQHAEHVVHAQYRLGQSRAPAWWADCPGIQGNRVIGNAFWDNPMGGMDNEAFVFDTITQGNVMYRNGVHSRVATRWNIVDNLFVEGGVAWNNSGYEPMPATATCFCGATPSSTRRTATVRFAAGWDRRLA